MQMNDDYDEQEVLLNKILHLGQTVQAPTRIDLCGEWYQQVIGIGKDYTARILIDDEAYRALLERGCSPVETDTDVSISKSDSVNHPKHYTSHPSGIECIQVTEHMGFNLGNAVKYIWRADLKNDAVEDLQKAKWYIERELIRRGINGQQ